MKPKKLHKTLTYIIALIWFANGLFCKILNLVPRHEQIVARILGDEHSKLWTVLIGGSEIIMMFWILSGFQKRVNVITQIMVITIMNILEFILVPELLLWGKLNAVFAFAFIGVIYFNEFHLNKK